MQELIQSINQLLNTLSKNWYDSKKRLFITETFYDHKKDKVYSIFEEYDEIYDDEKDISYPIPSEIVIDIDLMQYCWNSDFYQSRSYVYWHNEIEFNPLDYPKDAQTIAREIIELVRSHTQTFKEALTTHNCIIAVLNEIEQCVDSLILENKSEEEYCTLIKEISVRIKNKLLNSFKDTVKEVDFISFEDSLKFNLQQEELAALLFILSKAEIISSANYNDTRFLTFCQKYFYFKKNESYKKPSTLKSFSEKYKKFVRGEGSESAIQKIKKKLQDSLKGL